MSEDYGDVWVCQDCYFAHHYGARLEEYEADDLGLDPAKYGESTDEIPAVVYVWFAGEDDEPVGGWHEIRVNHTLEHNREPLRYLEGFEVADNTCSDHYYGQETERFDVDEVPCDQCGQTGWENGIEGFSWRACDGCHSSLGGSRHRLHLWKREEVNA